MIIKILTLFPEMFEGILGESILKRAIDKGVCKVELIDMRKYSLDKHHHVDDTPYGGGAGMVLACDVVHRAILDNATEKTYKILLTPQGQTYHDKLARTLSCKEELMLICGHYEGFDERIRSFVDAEISIGDYVLTGGELGAAVICDSVIRLLDSAIKKESHEDDSFALGLLEYPQYTRPYSYEGMTVPEVLVNGNHKLIAEFRKKEALRKTYLRRPDLLKDYPFTQEELKMLEEIKKEEA
ncbi:MAG: tRNA (guanosine(37)-N1)-methyltransferase TrmD [Anaeroplasmataceae bacterium]|nr:tRNA (guanosine(37)-N1)-methyltransferase TrmD [Anaeroplasmataceae bacterium]